MLRYFIKTFLSYGAIRVVAQLISFLLIPIYTKKLFPEEYSAIEYVSIVNSFITVITGMQLGVAAGRLLADTSDEVQQRKIISSGFWATLITMCTGAIVLALVYFITDKQFFFTPRFQHLFMMNLMLYTILGVYHYLNNVIVWRLDRKNVLITNSIYIILSLVTTILFVIVWNGHIQGSYYSMLLSNSFVVLLLIFIHRKDITMPVDFSILKKMLQYSAPLILTGLALQSWTFLDRNVILQYLGEKNLGLYALALKFCSPFVLGFTVVESILTPIVARHQADDSTRNFLKQVFSLHIIFLFISLLVIALFGAQLIPLVIDTQFAGVEKILFYVLLAQAFLKLNYFAPGFMLAKKNTPYLLLTLAFGILNYGANVYMAKHFSFQEMLWTNAIFGISYFFTIYAVSRKYYQFPLPFLFTVILLVVAIIVFQANLYYPFSTLNKWIILLSAVTLLLVTYRNTIKTVITKIISKT